MKTTNKIRRLADKKITQKMMDDEQQKYHPAGVSVQLHNLCYNLTIPAGIKTQPRRGAMIIDAIFINNIKINNNN